MSPSRSTVPITRRFASLCVATFLLIVLADWFFYERVVGFTAGLYTLTVTVLLLMRGWSRVGRVGAVLALLLTGLAAAMTIEPGALSIGLAAVLVVMLAMTVDRGWTSGVSAWWRRFALFVLLGWSRILQDARRRRRAALRYGGLSVSGELAQWVAPVALSLVFVGLFAAANPIIDAWVGDAAVVARRMPEHVDTTRIALWLLSGVWAWALLRPRVTTRRSPAATPPLFDERDLSGVVRLLTPETVVRSLLMFNAVFGVQTALDGMYLLGGTSLPDGLTYAEYAQRGAYPLIATALLAGLFVIVTFGHGAAASRLRMARGLVYVWLAQNVLLVGSATWRLWMYVEAYGLSRWRLAGALWMGLVALGLVWLLVRIVGDRSNGWLVRVNVLSVFMLLYVCCFWNIDGTVADYNVRHCRETTGEGVVLDIPYLESLGPDSLPALEWFARNDLDETQAARADLAQKRLRARLDHHLSDWRGWTLRRAALLPPE